MIYEIPLSGSPQRFTIALPDERSRVGVSNEYVLTFQWRDVMDDLAGGAGWVVDIADQYGTPMVCGIPLVTGADLLAQYRYLNFGGSIYVHSDGIPDATPTFDNLGSGSRVYWLTVE